MMQNIVVGKENIAKIAKILESEKEILTLDQKWSDLARNLGIHTTIWQQNYQLGLISFQGLLHNILISWSGKQGEHATLQRLFKVLKESGLQYLVDKLTLEFRIVPCTKIGSIPEIPTAYYISRNVTPRVKLDAKIFEVKKISDVFLISGLPGRLELGKLAGNNPTEVSGNQIWEITARFIFLEFEEHFYEISKKGGSKPLHWIHHENKEYFWKKSHGSLDLLQKFIGEDQAELREEDFVRRVLSVFNTTPICIADSPGMGKSTLLASIAHRCHAEFKDRDVLFFQLRKFIQEFGESAKDPANFFEKIESKAKKMELFLDGFDELLPEQINQCNQLLQSLKKVQNVRVLVTTRLHMRNELEETLGVLGYNIMPFDDTNQLQFLTRYWSTQCKAKDNELLSTFSKDCLHQLKDNLKDSERHIAGIPLQCRMIAMVYSTLAVGYSQGSSKYANTSLNITSIFDLYEKLMNHKLEKGQDLKDEERIEKKDKVLDAHVSAAFSLIFPHWLETLPSCMKHHKDLDQFDVCSLGLIEPHFTNEANTCAPRFVHQTFAEYLIAQHICQELTRCCRSCISLLFNTVLGEGQYITENLIPSNLGDFEVDIYRFKYPVINYFINSFLEKRTLKYDMIKNILYKPITKQLYQSHEILCACTTSSLIHCFKLAQNTLEIQLDDLKAMSLASTSAKYSNTMMMTQVVEVIEQCTSKRIKQLWFREIEPCEEIKGNLLYVAMHRGSYGLTDFLVKNLYDSQIQSIPYLLHFCVCDSQHDNSTIITEKKEIIKLIVDLNENTLEEIYPDLCCTPLLQDEVHPELIKFLIDNGADVNAVDTENFNSLLHIFPRRDLVSPTVYADMFEFVAKRGYDLWNHSNKIGVTPLYAAVQFLELTDGVLKTYAEKNVDFNAFDISGQTVLLAAVKEGRSLEFIKKLITYGCKFSKNNYGRGALHWACSTEGHYELVKYFIEEEAQSMGEEDNEGNTPLHSAFEKKENKLVQEYLISNATERKLGAMNKNELIPFMFGLDNQINLRFETLLKMQEKGLIITQQLSSQALALMLLRYSKNTNYSNYVKLFRHFLHRNGTVCKTKPSMYPLKFPWLLNDLVRKTQIDSPECREKVLFHLNLDITDYKTSSEFYRKVYEKGVPVEKLMLILLESNQKNAFQEIRKLFKLDKNQNYVNPPNGILEFIESSSESILVILAQNEKLCIERLLETVFGAIEYDGFAPLHNEAIYLTKSLGVTFQRRLHAPTRKFIFVTENEIPEAKCRVIKEELEWKDLSKSFQKKLVEECNCEGFALYASSKSQVFQILKNKHLSDLICSRRIITENLGYLVDHYVGETKHTTENLNSIVEIYSQAKKLVEGRNDDIKLMESALETCSGIVQLPWNQEVETFDFRQELLVFFIDWLLGNKNLQIDITLGSEKLFHVLAACVYTNAHNLFHVLAKQLTKIKIDHHYDGPLLHFLINETDGFPEPVIADRMTVIQALTQHNSHLFQSEISAANLTPFDMPRIHPELGKLIKNLQKSDLG